MKVAQLLKQTTLDNFVVTVFKQTLKEVDQIMIQDFNKKLKTQADFIQTSISQYFKVQRKLQSKVAVTKEIQDGGKKFGSCQIPYYFRMLSDNNEWRGVHYPLFEIIMKFLTVRECQTKFARVCRSWKRLDFKMFCSYSSFKQVENSRFTAKELKVVLKKGSKTLPHMRVYKEIIRRDFRNQFEFLNQHVTMQAKVADNLIFQIKDQHIHTKATLSLSPHKDGDTLRMVKSETPGYQKKLFQTFKIKALGITSTHNLLSDKSLTKICVKSRDSLEDLTIRNCVHLTNTCLSLNIGYVKRLIRLDLSYSKQIDDTVVNVIALELRNLKKLCLRFLALLTANSIAKILEFSKLEGLDLSGCFNVNLDLALVKLKKNATQSSLRCLLLEYLYIQPFHLYHLRSSKVHTLSLFHSSTVTDSHLDVLRQLKHLQELNVADCPQISEEGLCHMLEEKVGEKFSIVKLSKGLQSPKVMQHLQN